MKKLLKSLEEQAKKNPKTIIYPEATEPRILKAVYLVAQQGIAKPILLGDKHAIFAAVKKAGLNVSFFTKHIKIINPFQEAALQSILAEQLYAKRKHKGMTLTKAKNLLTQPIYFATMLVAYGEVDGLVSGSIHPTSHTFRPALQLLRKNKQQRMSSFFLMKHKHEFYVFADCAVTIDPSPKELAHIAVTTACSSQSLFGLRAQVAMLSFSTHGSNEHPFALKVKKATQLAQSIIQKRKLKNIVVDGELQADAALVPRIHDIKVISTHAHKGNHLKGRANILIFPNLEAANIAYKLVEWLGHYEAIGPITQGLGAAVNDLSRGCTVQDIVDVTAITVVQAQQFEKQRKHKIKHGGKK